MGAAIESASSPFPIHEEAMLMTNAEINEAIVEWIGRHRPGLLKYDVANTVVWCLKPATSELVAWVWPSDEALQKQEQDAPDAQLTKGNQ